MPEAETHSYRCPVCGHTDGVDLKAGVALRIPCSHCDTLLELRLDHGPEHPAQHDPGHRARRYADISRLHPFLQEIDGMRKQFNDN